MATKAKRKYVSKNDQEEMLKAFYDGLGDNENNFLVHRFPDEEEEDAESDSSDEDDNDKDNERDDGDEIEQECKIKDDSNYNNDVIPEEASASDEGEKKITRDQITRLMELTMYKKTSKKTKTQESRSSYERK